LLDLELDAQLGARELQGDRSLPAALDGQLQGHIHPLHQK
jgi:hypothetical protein